MARYGLPLDDENELVFFVHDSNGIEMMGPDDFRDWVWTEILDQPPMDERPAYANPCVWVFTRDDFPRHPRGTAVYLNATDNEDGTKRVAVNMSSRPVTVNGKPLVVKVGFPRTEN